MRKDLLIIALGLSLVTGVAKADVLATPETDPAAVANVPAALPAKGITMGAVQKQFGEPMRKRPAVGGDSAKQPPITRWDYAGFSVIFEHDRVIDAVVPGAPPRIYNKDRLTPVAASAAPLPPVAPAAELAPPPEESAPIIAPPESGMAPESSAAEAAAAPMEPESSLEQDYPSDTGADTPDAAYPDAPAPAEDIPQDQPPTPK
jgi:hypothetical protein